MLKQRVITALVLLIIVLGAILTLPFLLFELFLAAVVVLAAWEWGLLAGLKTGLGRMLYTVSVLLGICLGIELPTGALQGVFALNLVWWGLSFSLIYLYPKYSLLWGSKIFVAVSGFFVLFSCFFALMTLRGQLDFAFHILLLLGLVAAADIGAYFSGRAFGKHKLAPQVSPNKTWEGVWGGMLFCCALLLGVDMLATRGALGIEGLSGLPQSWFSLLVWAILVSIFSVVGDLTESILKRVKGVKESGSILPGHGGILDRIDGITAAAPLYAFLLISFGDK